MKHRKCQLIDKQSTWSRVVWLMTASLSLIMLMSLPAAALEGGSPSDQVSRDIQSETGFGAVPFLSYVGPGADFVKVGVTTRVFNIPAAAPPQSEPFVITVPTLPAGAVVVETIVLWNYLLNGQAPTSDLIEINGNSVTGLLVAVGSPDLCWSKGGTAVYASSGLTALIGPGNLPVNVTIAHATDKAIGSDLNAYGEGLSILVVYTVPGQPVRIADVYFGYTSTESNPLGTYGEATLNFLETYYGGNFHFFINALDGQEIYVDSFFINGVNVGGLVAGTSSATNGWIGLLGPSASGVNNVYDHANDDLSSLVLAPATSMTIRTQRTPSGSYDCIGHSFAAVSFPLCVEGKTIIDPDTMFYYQQNAINPSSVCIFVGDFCDCPTDGIVPVSFVVNGTITPDSAVYLPGHPGFYGDVWKLFVSMKKFLSFYGSFLDWDVYDYHVTGSFIDDICDPFDLTGQVTLRGHVSGDVDLDGEVSVGDLTYLVSYLFNGGAAPPFLPTADLDKDGRITVADLSLLVHMLFFE